MLKGSAKMAVNRVKDRMRAGATLMKMHSRTGPKWYVVPGGGKVDEEVAKKVIAEPDVHPQQDGLFPGIHQSYRICD